MLDPIRARGPPSAPLNAATIALPTCVCTSAGTFWLLASVTVKVTVTGSGRTNLTA